MFITSLWLNQMLIVATYVSMLFRLKGLRQAFELFNDFFKRHGSIVGRCLTLGFARRCRFRGL